MTTQLITFPAPALPRPTEGGFAVPFTGWLFKEAKPDEGAVPKKILHRLIRKHVEWSEEQRNLFDARAALFLRTGLGKELVRVMKEGKEIWSGFTTADGFVQGTLYITKQDLNTRLSLVAGDCETELSLVLPKLSDLVVVSDIDDTLKLSAVWSLREMLARTFASHYEPIPEVAACFKEWEKEGAEFHYVSTSPWQLYSPLIEFMKRFGFPDGALHLRRLNWRRPNPFKRRSRSKIQALLQLFAAYPNKRFILVGDDVEKDPELYSKVSREFPGLVDKVFIRNVREEKASLREFHRAQAASSVGSWQSFSSGSDLQGLVRREDF